MNQLLKARIITGSTKAQMIQSYRAPGKLNNSIVKMRKSTATRNKFDISIFRYFANMYPVFEPPLTLYAL